MYVKINVSKDCSSVELCVILLHFMELTLIHLIQICVTTLITVLQHMKL